ncbi:2-dehydro-3-deoxy-D-gluconate 5-dehydrogenase [Burkholderiales bacterium]|nr:2-dehydro-3-deoxy-D-gluconate 5-dehydrogenase [Burkholderiales bacterium]
MQLTLDGKVALVTGAFGGLGRDFARMLARAGATVALAGRRIEDGRAIAQAMRDEGVKASAFRMDVTDRGSVDAAVDEVVATMGGVDVLVNNAGVALTRPFLDLTESDWTSIRAVNLDGAFRVAQAAARAMRDAGRGGSIVNIASVLATRVAAQVAPYATTKAALVQLTKAMALELARERIRVNALAPGYIETPINRDFFATEGGRELVKRIPQRRLGRVEDLEGPLLLLASDASAFMTGAVIAVDGGHAVSSL